MASTYVLALLFVCVVVAAQEEKFQFTEIANVPQNIVAVWVDLICPNGGKRPKTMLTFAPSEDGVSVSTYPANLITFFNPANVMRIHWNSTVAKSADTGGVLLKFPSAQLKQVVASFGSQVQILDGFTSIETLQVDSGSKLNAVLTTLTVSSVKEVSTNSESMGNVILNVPVDKVSAYASSSLMLQAPRIDQLDAHSSGTLAIKGNVVTASLASNATVRIDGALTGASTVSSANLNVKGELRGAIDVASSSGAQIRTTSSCATSAWCHVVSNLDSVHVQVEEHPSTLAGTYTCGTGPWEILGMPFLDAVLSVLAVSACCMCCCKRRRRDPVSYHSITSTQLRDM